MSALIMVTGSYPGFSTLDTVLSIMAQEKQLKGPKCPGPFTLLGDTDEALS